MKNQLLSRILIFFLLFALAGSSFSQTPAFKQLHKVAPPASFTLPGQVQAGPLVMPLKQGTPVTTPTFVPRQLNPSAFRLDPAVFTDTRYDKNGKLLFTEGRLPDAIGLTGKSSEAVPQACIQYLDALRQTLGIKQPGEEFIVKSYTTDELGMEHIRMQQVLSGIPVYGAELYLHGRDGFIDRYNGRVAPTPALNDLNPSVPIPVAEATALDHVGKQTKSRELSEAEKKFLNYDHPVTELVIYPAERNHGQDRLAWHVTVRPNIIERWEYFIDAGNGEILRFYDNTQSDGDVTASGTDLNGVNRNFHVYLQSGSYYMVDVTKAMFNPQTFEGVIKTYDAFNAPYNQITNASIVTSASNTWSPNAISAHYHAVLSYDYWKNVHGRNSFNGNGADIPNVINITDENGQGFDNAFWNGQAMFYGNGSMFKPLAGGLDVCAHELGHAVDETSANLEYQNESGAINESYSDIIGAMVERRNWKIGEDIIMAGNPYFPTGAMRDMSNPHNGGSSFNDPCYQPAQYSEMYNGGQDNGGVHTNSGVGNFAYYKYATAVGLEKGEKTFMRALFNYLTRSSQYHDLRIAVIQSAKDLYGNGSAEMNAAAAAFDQVGITESGGSGGGGGTTEPGNLQVNPGQDYILLLDEYAGDQYTLYAANTTGTQFTPISSTGIHNKPSVPDDGMTAYFISDDNKMRMAILSDNPTEQIIQDDAIWDGISVSKDGSLVSAVTIYIDSSIYVYSYEKHQWKRFHLYNPGTQPGVVTYNVLYADAMEFLYDGEYLMYDSYSQINGPQGQQLDLWDINFLRVWDKANNTWGDGQIFKLISGLEPGVSIGNPSLTKNSTYIAAFDYMDSNTGNNAILAANLDNGDVAAVYENGTTLGTPNYSKLDNQLIFTTRSGLYEDISVIGMQADKIHPDGNATTLITEAKWGIWFAQGNRPLGLDEPLPVIQQSMGVYPNPFEGKVTLMTDPMGNEPVEVSVFDLQGKLLFSRKMNGADNRIELDLSFLKAGFYMVRITGTKFVATGKMVKN